MDFEAVMKNSRPLPCLLCLYKLLRMVYARNAPPLTHTHTLLAGPFVQDVVIGNKEIRFGGKLRDEICRGQRSRVFTQRPSAVPSDESELLTVTAALCWQIGPRR